jgi:hypothetical protein
MALPQQKKRTKTAGEMTMKLRSWLATSVLLGSFLILNCPLTQAQKFRPDDPIWQDDDTSNIPAPKRRNLADYYDFLENTFGKPGDEAKRRAANINTLGEVPDSSWFTNRHGKSPMSLADLVRGPDTGGPSQTGKWQVIKNKVGGISPGFRIIDPTGTTYQLKFDPPSNPEMATSAEVICTKFFHAIGYYVAQDYIVYFSRDQIELSPKAEFEDLVGRIRPMKERDFDEILARAWKGADGKYRAVASKFIPGRFVGEYRYHGVRPDDPNDIIPHEHRRELRGLRVFSAWLNHDDSRSINTFDSLVTENGRQFIRHYLFDFGSTLGSATNFPQKARAGNEYMWEPGPTFKTIFSLGLWVRPWIKVDYPNYPSIGNFEADFFQPEEWKPEYPNPAFLRMTEEDAFWAARIVMGFTDEQIRAIVKTGQLTDPKAEAYLIECLIKRRDKIGRYWLNQLNPLDGFKADQGSVAFDNAAVRLTGSAPADSHDVQWYRFDNVSEKRTAVGPKQAVKENRLTIPAEVFDGPASSGAEFAVVEISSRSSGQPKWARPVHVYLRKSGTTISILGIERD